MESHTTDGTNSSPRSFEDLPMRVGLGQFMNPTPERLRFIKQLGVDDVLLNMYQYDPDYPHMPENEQILLEGEKEWSFENLRQLRKRIEDAGLRLNAIENVPISFYEKVMLGQDGREEQIEHMKTTIRNMGRAGIPIFGYHWMPSGVWRTYEDEVRGGATVTGFDSSHVGDELTHDREYTEEEMWKNYEYFVKELVPVAEESGVKICLHPNDPPVERIGGIPQLFRNFENFKRGMEIKPSDYHGLEFCLGSWSQMGEDLERAIRYFGERDMIFYVHFRDVSGTVPRFHETWVDEGNYATPDIVRLLRDVEFTGMMIPDHTPHIDGDDDWESYGRAYTVGYLRGLLDNLDRPTDC